ncbi:aldose 1-epimerase [Phaeodactylibacter luteus]|uniref:Aldose 1-epimerase n=1 Tax=Phaeodactylibacter luteus TaxID=1564516 RepID=A0A5C6RL60_9BACT|nr:aldose 1-epimerase [Phaeodactylibacter luteus]TXB63118.1 aldose 1-epimerase [Phaeodactylibacter luteus]
MFTIDTSDYGPFTAYCLSGGDTSLTLVPGFGACVTSLKLNGQECLDAYQSPKEMQANLWAKNLLLYPFPNRLRRGQYTWGGIDYQFPINDAPTENALHGFGLEQRMEVAWQEATADGAGICCRFDYDGELSYYPFPFRLEAIFRVSEGAFRLGLRVENTGYRAMPFGMGWHPYFRLSDDLANHLLCLPPCDMIGVDANMIPTGKRYEYTTFSQPRRINAEVLDNAFALRQQEGQVQVRLQYQDATLTYWQECGPGKYPYVQLFTPPHRNCLAIEPMTCNIDAFNNGEGLWRLAPGEEGSTAFGLSLQ